jgi:aminoglycoside phosphotransferase (APT) family kinase protein
MTDQITRMHEGEVITDVSLVKRLLASQFPQWAELPIKPVPSSGTDNALYRLGKDKAVRLPRIDWAIGQVEKEHKWMPKFAPHLPLSIPNPLVMGKPDEGYPWQWSVYQWIKGENLTIEQIPDPIQAAIDLAQFINALQQVNTTDGPLAKDHGSRGEPLSSRDEATREAIMSMHGMLDTDLALKIWDNAMQASNWDNEPVWFHGDLLPGNLLFHQGRLSAVIDFGGLGVGDPACDIMIAWGLFTGESRNTFQKALKVDDATWARGRGHALSQAVIFVPYYLETNPIGVRNAMDQIENVFADYQTNG